MRMQLCLATLCAVACGFVNGQGVTRQYQDLDGDGVAEVVMENDFLKVSVMTGEAANPMPEPTVLPDGRKVPYKYGNRFNWGGWVYNITFKPTNRNWFINRLDGGEVWHGIPEEFEEAILMKELEPGVYATMIPGIGTAVGTGRCFRWSLRDVKHTPWTMEEFCLLNGEWKKVARGEKVEQADGWRLTFTNKITTEYGYGCEYQKEMTLLAGDSALRTYRILRNTGEKDFKTTWFTHGFWGHGKDGHYDRDSWSIMPLRPPQVVGSAYPNTLRDTEPGYARAFSPGYYWGPISQEEVGGSWHACGNRANGDVFVSGVNRPLAFFRIWTHDLTYSFEPFLALDVKAGSFADWTTYRMTGNGLTGMKNFGKGGLLDWKVVQQDNIKELHIQFLPTQKINGALRLEGQLEHLGSKSKVEYEADAAEASPVKPWTAVVKIPQGMSREMAITIRLKVKEATENGAELVSVDGTYRLDTASRTAWNGNANGAAVTVFGDVNRNEDGTCNPNFQMAFWKAYLEDAGFKVSLDTTQGEGAAIDWKGMKLAVVSSRKITMPLLRKLEAFAKNGGAVVVTGMIDFKQFEMSDLLPIENVTGEVNTSAFSPRDGTREFMRINEFRYHLKGNGRHDITNGLPLYPESCQGIGAVQRVVPKADAQVVANFVAARGLADAGTEYPALVIGKYGKGKVAYFATPITWGTPAACSMWGRLGEYHEKFFNQLTLYLIKN
ncbi:MAG: hypothetical protein K5787_02200 [Lentisphaeria bacterium]|nr:hypothetical protein [Lentisphaeria bacterium]